MHSIIYNLLRMTLIWWKGSSNAIEKCEVNNRIIFNFHCHTSCIPFFWKRIYTKHNKCIAEDNVKQNIQEYNASFGSLKGHQMQVLLKHVRKYNLFYKPQHILNKLCITKCIIYGITVKCNREA